MRVPQVFRELRLATKLLVLFGVAITLVIVVALSLPWLRMQRLVDEGQRETARELLTAWRALPRGDDPIPAVIGEATVREFAGADLPALSETDAGLADAYAWLGADPERRERFEADWRGWERRYRLYTASRGEDGTLASITLLERTSEGAGMLLAVNSLYILGAGAVVLAFAVVVVYLILSRLILRPVRSLFLWADAVRDGNLDEKIEIRSGDEFEELATTVSLMLDGLREQQRQLRAVNLSMDVKLNELSEANEALDRAGRRKAEFVASVSHELRTPLNSVIGFAELLLDLAREEAASHTEPGDEPPEPFARRQRYLENILTSARGLLELIEGLLELTRIEAGKAQLRIEAVNLAESCRGLAGIMHPLAQRKHIRVRVEDQSNEMTIRTDPRRLQQVIFNLLSNAVKFTDETTPTGAPGEIIVRIERLASGDGVAAGRPSVRVSVIDNGPGIDPEDQERIFEKYQQLDGGHTRSRSGIGLGLAICRELVGLLQGELQVVSDRGQGSMFSVLLPDKIDMDRAEEFRLESMFRGALAGGRDSGN